MTYDDMITRITEHTDCSPAKARVALASLFEDIADELSGGGTVRLPGIGSLTRVATQERVGRNPTTGAKLTIPAGHKIKFSLASAMKARMLADAS